MKKGMLILLLLAAGAEVALDAQVRKPIAEYSKKTREAMLKILRNPQLRKRVFPQEKEQEKEEEQELGLLERARNWIGSWF